MLPSAMFMQALLVVTLVLHPVLVASRPSFADVQSNQGGSFRASSFGMSSVGGGGGDYTNQDDPGDGFWDPLTDFPTSLGSDSDFPTESPTVSPAPSVETARRPGLKTTSPTSDKNTTDREESSIFGASSVAANIVATAYGESGGAGRPIRPSFVRPVNLPATANISMSGSSWGSSPAHTDTAEEKNATLTIASNATNATDAWNYDVATAPTEAHMEEDLVDVEAEDIATLASTTMVPSPSPTFGAKETTMSPTWSFVAATEATNASTSVLDNLPSYGSLTDTPAPAPTTATPDVFPTLPEKPLPTEPPSFPQEEELQVDSMVTVEGRTSLLLHGLVEDIPQDTDAEMVFTMAAYEFVSSALAGAPAYLEVTEVKIDRQQIITIPNPLRRNRRELLYLRTLEQQMSHDFEALQVDLLVIGTPRADRSADEEAGLSTDASTSELLEEQLYKLFREDGRIFLDTLKESSWAQGEAFFTDLVAVEAKERKEDANTWTASSSTLAPTEPTLTLDDQGNLVFSEGEAESSEGGLPLILVIGTAIACGVLLLLLIGVGCYVKKTRTGRTKVPGAPDEVGATSMSSDEQIPPAQRLAAVTKKSMRKKGSKNKDPSPPQADLPESLRFSDQDSDTGSSLYTASNNPSNPYGLGQTASSPDIEDEFAGAGDYSVMDNSYAYSLEPGIEPSVVGGLPLHILPSGSQSIGGSYSLVSAPGGGSGSVTSGTSSFALLRQNRPNNPNLIRREIMAPSGKLGIVIDTTLDGPVVHKVNPGSALEGKIWSGDIIIGIDGVDTRAMSAASITALMVKTANQRRKLTILSDCRR